MVLFSFMLFHHMKPFWLPRNAHVNKSDKSVLMFVSHHKLRQNLGSPSKCQSIDLPAVH